MTYLALVFAERLYKTISYGIIIMGMRGQVFTLDGMKLFAMGGAASHDKHLRREGITWWPEELPSDEEYHEAVLNLQAHDNTVDYIVTHCAPDSVQWEISDHYESDKLTEFLEAVRNEVSYKHWYFGHYHLDEDIDDRHTCVFDKIVLVGCLSGDKEGLNASFSSTYSYPKSEGGTREASEE